RLRHATFGADHRRFTSIDGPERPDVMPLEGTAHAFPALRDLAGRPLADGDFSQWLEADRLHIASRYDFTPNRWIQERTVFRQQPELVQEEWTWYDERDGGPVRRYTIDFRSVHATAEKWEEKGHQHQSTELKIDPGRTFAGIGFVYAIKRFRERLLRGETIR